MQSFRQPEAFSSPSIRTQLPIPTAVAIGLGSLPLVAIIAAGHVVASALVEIGEQSEELFRGERLPSLPLMRIAESDSRMR